MVLCGESRVAGVLRRVGLILQRRYWDEDPKDGDLKECLEFAVSLDEWLATLPSPQRGR